MNRKIVTLGIALPLMAAAVTAPLLRAANDKPKYTIKEVMKNLHKGDENVGKKVSRGEGTKADFDKMVDYYSSLPLNDPPRGDKDSWHEKTMALVNSAKDLQAGKPGAVESYKKAANCKACHMAHKPEQKK
jgi:hypothetical protein